MNNQDPTHDINSTKPFRLGVALSGGGARGFAHAGALLAIEAAGLQPDIIAGVSAGAIVSVLYAAGVKPLDMAKLFGHSHMRDFTKLSLGNGGIFRLERLRDFILKNIGDKYQNLEDLNIPTYIGVTDFDNGRATEFHSGPIGDRMIASCSIPIVFKPVKINGINYVDGAILRNHPAWIIRDKCDFLIGINISPLRNKQKGKTSIINAALRSGQLMVKANQTTDMDLCDISVSTADILDNSVFSMKHIKDMFLSGFYHMRHALKEADMWHPEQVKSKLI